MTIEELIKELQRFNQSKSVSFSVPIIDYGERTEIEYKFASIGEEGSTVWIDLRD